MTTHTIAMIGDMLAATAADGDNETQTGDNTMTTNIKYDFLGVKLDGDVVLHSSGFHGEYDSDAQAEHQARRIYEDHDFDRVIITRGDVSWGASRL